MWNAAAAAADDDDDIDGYGFRFNVTLDVCLFVDWWGYYNFSSSYDQPVF